MKVLSVGSTMGVYSIQVVSERPPVKKVKKKNDSREVHCNSVEFWEVQEETKMHANTCLIALISCLFIDIQNYDITTLANQLTVN